MENVLSAIGYEDDTTLSLYQEEVYLHMTKLATFMETTQCALREYDKFTGGWLNMCPTASSLPVLTEGVSCTLDETCKQIKCCVHVPFLNRNVIVAARIDPCENLLLINVDKFVRTFLLSSNNFGINQQFSLFELFNVTINVKYLSPSRSFILDMDVNVCLQTGSCDINTKLLDGTRISVPSCNFTTGFLIEDFSLNNWASSSGISDLSEMSQLQMDSLFEDLDISRYYQACTSASGHDTEKCDSSLLISTNGVNCYFEDACTNVTCCVDLPPLNTSIQINLDILPCALKAILTIGTFQRQIPLVNMEDMESIMLSLGGFVKSSVTIRDLSHEQSYLVDLSVTVCTESNEQCILSIKVFENALLPKDTCNWSADEYNNDFSILTWTSERGLVLGNFTDVDSAMLLDRLQMSHILGDGTCPAPTSNGCLLKTTEAVQCALSETCLRADCCIHSKRIATSFQFAYDIDICNFKAKIQIEKLVHTLDLFTYDFGTSQELSLFGLLTLRYSFDMDVVAKSMRISLIGRVCLDKTTCDREIVIANNTVISLPSCEGKLKNTYGIEEFSLSNWLTNFNTNKTMVLPDFLSSYLLDQLGISYYLEENRRCPHVSGSSWNKDVCPQLTDVLPSLPDTVKCSLTTCTSASCCYNSSVAKLPIHFSFDVDPCELRFDISLEKLTYSVSLVDYNFGNEEQLWIGGVFRLRFRLYDILAPKRYVAKLYFDICWERHECETIVLLNNTVLLTEPCNYTSGFASPDFSLTSWKEENGIEIDSIIPENFQKQLIDDLDITNFLQEDTCTAMKEDVQGCPLHLPLVDDQLKGTQCQLLSHCTGVRCCITSTQTGLNFEILLDVDPCTQMLAMQIENYKKEIPLHELQYGTNVEFWLQGVVRMRFYILELKEDRSYIMTLEISLCFEANSSCEFNYSILKETKLPKYNCEWGPGLQTMQDFSISQWLDQMSLMDLESADDYVYDILFTDLGIAEFLREQQCVTNIYPFTEDVNNECIGAGGILPSDGPVHCHITTSCQTIECCTDVDVLHHTFYTYLAVDICNMTLSVGIEQYVYTISLVNYQFGALEHFWLQEFARMDFRVYNIESESSLVVNLDISFCLDTSDCHAKQTVLSQAQLPYTPCKLDEEFSFKGFSWSSWLEQHNLIDYTDITPMQLLTLSEQLQLSKYLLYDEECTANSSGNDSGCLLNNNTNSEVLTCALPSCLSLGCCINFYQLHHVFRFAFNIDNCNQNIHIALDKFSVDISLLDFQWNSAYDVFLKGVVRISFRIEDLEHENAFLVSLSLRLCLEDEECFFETTVFNNMLAPKAFCDYSVTDIYPIKDFSLVAWMSDQDISGLPPLSQAMSTILLDSLGVSNYLGNSCDQSGTGSTSSCGSVFGVHQLPVSVICSFSDNCLEMTCCYTDSSLLRTFAFSLMLDPCSFLITATFDNYSMTRSFFDFNMGVPFQINFGGILRFEYSINNLAYGNAFLVNALLKTCFESSLPCVEIPLLSEAIFEKPVCSYDLGFAEKDFSLQKWLSSNGILHESQINSTFISKLYDKLNLSPYLLEEQCPFNSSQTFSTDCEFPIDVQQLPNNINCHLDQSCTSFTCCVDISTLQRTFLVKFRIDSCENKVERSIEKYRSAKYLFNYNWGETETMSLFGVIRQRLSVDNLEAEKKFIVNFGISICLESDSHCLLNLAILTDATIPKTLCDWNSEFLDKDFDYLDWRRENNILKNAILSQNEIDVLMDELGVTPYLTSNCQTSNKSTDDQNWVNDCPMDISLPTLPEGTQCMLRSDCFFVECCTYLDFIRHDIHTRFHLEPCTFLLNIELEKLSFTINLFEFEFGEEYILRLYGVFALRFKMQDLSNSGFFVIDISLEICQSTRVSCTQIHVFEKMKIPKPTCDLGNGFKIPNFSLEKWKTDNGVAEKGFDPLSLSQLYEYIGIAPYLQQRPCETNQSKSWTSVCPNDLSLTNLTESVSCSIGRSCADVRCCLYSQTLQRTFTVEMSLDACVKKLNLAIEQLYMNISLYNFEWGQVNTFSMFGVVRLGYTIDYLELSNVFIASLNVSVCLEADSNCEVNFEVLSGTILPIQPCDLDTPYKIPDFSLTHWLEENRFQVTSVLDVNVVSDLFEILGITNYLQTNQCSPRSDVYAPGIHGWRKECGKNVHVPDLHSDVACLLTDSCNGISCCLTSHLVGRSFEVAVDLDHCEQTLHLRIEKLAFDLPIDNIELGQPIRFCLFGVVCLELSIKDLVSSDTYIVSLDASVCFESSSACSIQSTIFESTLLPKQACSRQIPNPIQDFDLTTWLNSKAIPVDFPLHTYIIQDLFNAIGLSNYLEENTCTFGNTTASCRSECLLPIETPFDDETSSCQIQASCTSIDVCTYVEVANQNMHIYLHLDACKQIMFVGIEHFNFTISFGDILWGQENIVSLRDVLIIRYKLTHLPVTNVFVVDLSAHICMQNKNCEQNVTILDNTELPILPCTWNQDFANQTFSYQAWLDSNGYINTTLNDGIRKELFDSLGIGRYINQNKCYRSIYPYANSEYGWTTDCQSYVELPKLSTSVTCFLSDSCTAVKCCLDIDILQSSIEFELVIDACEQEIHVGIESLRTTVYMQTYDYGASEAFYLGGVLKMDYIIENFDRGRKYAISLNISVCLEFDEPCLTEVILESHVFRKTACDWSNGFNVEGFSLFDWKRLQNIQEHEVLTPTEADILMDHLGLAQYLNHPQCITHNQWENDCPLDIHIGAPVSNVFCSIDSTCLNIDCCIAIEEIGRNFSVFVHIDKCEQKISYGIEGIEDSKTFEGFHFDRTNHFDLDGLLDVRLLVSNQLHERKLFLSLFVDEYHNDTDVPTQEYGLIQNAYIPATHCVFESGFRDKEFSLPLWMSTHFPSHVGQEIDEYILATLLEDIGIADYLLPQQCTVETSNAIDTTICPIDQQLRSISSSVSCALKANCIGVHCCLTSTEFHLTFDFSVDIDNCREKMIVRIERVSYTVLFKDLLWGETMNFDLDGIFKISVLADMVWSDKLFNLTISTSVCTDANGTCIEENILENQLLQATPCSWTSLTELEGFDVSLWLEENGISDDPILSDTYSDTLMSVLGMSGFFQTVQCNLKEYGQTNNGWTSVCAINLGLSNLPSTTACHLDATCSTFTCCVNTSYIQKTFEYQLEIDSCEQKLLLRIERVTVVRSFSEIEFGQWESFHLNGVFRLTYLIEDVTHARMFIASARSEVCLDNNICILDETILYETKIPYRACDMDSDYILNDFSLSHWKDEHGVNTNATLDEFAKIELLDELGITMYLKSENCSSLIQNDNLGKWKTECPSVNELDLTSLPQTMSCTLHADCLSIACCMSSDVIEKSVYYAIALDYCNRELTVQVENMKRTFSVYDYKFGSTMAMSIYSVLRLRWTMWHLVLQDQVVLNMHVMECFENDGPCDQVESVATRLKLPLPDCSSAQELNTPDFSLRSWKADHGITGNTLTDSQKLLLQRDLGLVRHMNDEKCVVQTEDQGYEHGWISECPLDLNLANITEQYNISCKIQSSCSQIHCCLYVPEMDMSFTALFDLQPCNLSLKVGFEMMTKEMNIKEMTGTETVHSLNSVLHMSSKVTERDDELQMEWAIRVCVEDQFECTRQIRILENVFIPKPDCWSEPIFEIQGFSMQSWLSDNNVTLGDMLEEHHDKLAVDLGLVNMVSSPMCNITTSMQDFDFEFINSSSSIYDQSCVRSSTDEYVACCVYSEELDRYLWASFTIEPCRYQINVQLENLAYNINTLDYIWGTRHEVSMKGVWSIRFLIHNVQTNREFSLDVDVRICFEDGACNGTFFLAADFRLPYTNCTNTTQPYQDISHDFWLREECSASTTSTGCTSVHLPNATRDICFLDDDCRGLTCCAELYLGDVTRNAMFSIRSDCNGTALNFSIERKSWQTNIQSKPAYIHQNIKDAILLDITVNNDSPITIKVSVNLSLCEKISGEIACVALPYLIDQPLNVQCSTRKRRKRSMLPAEFSIEDIKLKLKELFEKGSSNKEIQSYIDALKIVQKAQKAKNMAPEDVEVLDSTIKQAMKALGWNNPETIKHQPVPEGGYTFSYEIGGAETILEMLGDSNSMISRANQLFIVGKGLSKLGTELLGAQLANMTIGDIESLLHTKKVDPFKIRDIVKAFIDLARVLYSEVMEKLLSGSYKNIFESFELTLKGTFSFPKKNIRFFPEPWYQSIPLGGFLEITLEFDAWGYYGLDVGWQAKIISRSAGATLLPYAGLSTFFEAGIGFILYGKLRLEGQICNIDFPSTAEIGFSRFPLDVGIKMDLKIKPLKLELFGLVTLEVNLLFVRFKKTLFKKRIWHYEMAQISTRVIDASTKEEDVSPPDFSPVVSKTSSRSGRALTECVLRQIANRDYTEPAFEIAVKAADDRSNVKFFLDVGTFQGGNDIVSNMQLGGSETVVKTESNEYPSGVPLYFIMFAENSAGSRSLLNCELYTYDSTPPTGRVNVEFTSTSNPNIIRATILVHDDSDISETLVAIGLGTEHYGDQLLRWEHLMLKDNSNRKFGNQPLDEFTQLQEGKLVTSPINSLSTVTASDCAQECLKIPPCHSFNYDYGQSMACELLPSMRHFDESLHMDSQFHHFERLSSGKFVEISYDSFDMRHNTLHFVNLDVTNVLGYRSVIHSQGILTDFSCPEPGLILNGSLDALSFVNCHTLVPSDRPDPSRFCTGQTAVVPNHRTVIDGPGSRTVFNGDNPMTETLYSRSNNYIAANWDGIHDNETGILVYTWFVGRSVCEDSIHPDVDPHKHLLHESHWRNIGIISSSSTNKNIFPLSSGRYYVSVRAMNKVHFGGFLGTTICHSIPYVIDITSPFIYEIYAIKYNEDTFLVSALHNSTDEESGIAYMDACLGRDLWSCNIMSWARSSTLTLIQFTFQIPDGTPAWLRLRATNNVDLHVVERANRAILLDASPPIAGVVNDGEIYSEDLQFTKYSDKICTNWHDFHDPESGISKHEIGVGSKPGMLDVVGLEGVKHNEHLFCFKLQENETLVHDNVYYITLWAFNAATNMKNVSKSSDGVRVDLTKPLQGNVVDGDFSNFKDRKYSHSKSSVQVQWNNFHDPESGIRSYSASVERNRAGQTDVVKTEDDIDAALTFAAWKNLNLKHLDYIRSTIIAFNGALNENSNSSDGILIDLTSPTFEFIYDGTSLGTDIRFQSSLEELSVNYEVQDIDSGIVELKAQIHIVNQGFTKQLYPGGSGEWIVLENPKTTVFTKENLQLTLGSKYKFRFGAVNGAGLTAIFESDGVITDNTQPELEHLEVGVLSGDDEEIVFGYVWQADHDGIKASWVSSDHESGIIGVRFAVGTTPGSDDVLGWTTQEKYSKDAYLPCVLTDTDLSDSNNYFPVYFVSLATQNGAGLWSPVKTSTPIVVVPEDVTGIAVDGPRGGISNDIDYQGDMHTVTMSFSGFKSSLHGIQTYDWAIGTTPQGEDVQPYLEYAIRHSETEVSDLHGIGNEGQAQVTVDIEPKKTYFTTLRAITNAGNILQTKTDGFIVDTTPPNINILTLNSQSLESGKSVFQTDETALAGTWSYNDSEIHDANNVDNILHTTFSIGTYPFATDVANIKNLNASVDGTSSIDEKSILPALQGIPNILSVTVTNKANITAKAYSQSLIQDNTEPDTGIVECHEYIQSHFNVTCVWSGFADLQSKVERFYIFFGFEEGFDNIAPAYELSGDVHSYVTSALPVSHADTFYATVIAENSVGLQVRAYSSPISVDDTPPVSGVVVELKSASYIDPSDYEKTVQSTKMACESPDECNMVDAVCQEKMNTIRAAWSPFIDAESGIKSLQVAVGTIPGGGQLKPFFQIPNSAQNFEITGINLYDKREIFVTIKAENNAGKTASVISNGVFLSYLSQEMPPLYHIGVYDSNQHSIGDIDYQVEASSLEAKWDVSGDPCPVIKYEWAIESTDGRVIQNFTDMYTSTHGVNDQLNLKEGERYYSLLRVTNAIGYSYTLRSNGVTVSSDVLIPGEVYDGAIQGYDLTVQQSRTNVSANWDAFGKVKSALEGQLITGNQGFETNSEEAPEIEYYEVALGTDRRFPKTRDNVVPFTNVGRKTSVTFLNLDLDSGDVVYYFTVRAYSKTFATAFAMSNGFYVKFNGGVNAGEISMPSFVNDTNQLQYSWNGFSSEVDIMVYYIALSNGFANESDCKKYIVGQNGSDMTTPLFNIVGVTNVQVDTMVLLDNLDLIQNNTYYAWVLGLDKSGECNMTYHRFNVDITPPTIGNITAGPYYDMDIAYSSSSDTLRVQWKGFADNESGISRFNLTLWTSSHCRENALLPTVSLDVLSEYTNHTFYNITLKPETVYFVSVEAVNNALLRTVAFTSPIIYDSSKPSAGYVAEGADIKVDVVWWGNASSVIGTLLHYPLWVDDECPQQDAIMTGEDWTALDIEHINDPDGIQWGLKYRPANVHIVNKDEIKIKMSRDTKFKRLYSGAYMKSADFVNDGLYEINIKTNKNEGLAVTGVTFWDGQSGDLHLFHHNPVENWASIDECLCCQAESEVNECPCNCTEYWNNFDSNATSTDYSGSESASLNSTLYSSLVVPAERACGIQIYGGSNPYVVTWCRFYNTSYQPMSVTSDLQFDPAENYHKYSIQFLANREDLQVTQCIKAYADQYELSEMCGIPQLSKTTMLILHVWNKNSIIPEMNVFNSWTSYSFFKTLKLPPNDSELCRYAQPWKGGTIPIISYEAGIGSSRTVADVVDFRQVIQPCIPCSGLCSELICNSSCVRDTYTSMMFTIYDTDLSFHTNGSLYIIVKSLLGSGERTLSASNGFYIDTSPPTFDLEATFYIDVNQGEFTPAEYQGSSDTIKAVWFCEDDLNEIREYEWAIGSYIGGEDLQRYTSTGVTSIGTNTSFEGILKSNTTYYVSVRCTNEAGLVTVLNDTKGVTVLLEAPSEDSINTSAVNADKFDEDVFPPTALETSDPTSCGERWSESSDDTVDRYDFCIGSSKMTPDDIVPCVWVAVNTSGTVEIKDGHMYINGVQYFKLSELQAYSKAHYTVKKNSNNSENIFNMEPGRTVFLFMRICNKAQICSFKLTNSVIVKGKDSSLAISKNGTAMSVILGQSPAGKQKRSSEYSINATFPGGMNDGQSVLLKELSEEELTTIYQSDATPAFKPYIVNPFETLNKTERLLYKRTYYVEQSFTISPIGQEEVSAAIEITHQQINFDDSDPDSNITMLLHWNPDEEEWQISSRSCQDNSETETHYPDLGVTVVKVCNTRTHNSSNDTQQYMYKETQFAVATVRAGPFNSPPYLISPLNISLLEDSEFVTFQLYARDDELDDIVFTQSNFQHPIGNIELNNSGWLEIELCANCYGHLSLEIELKDTPSFVEVTPAKSIGTINVYVVEQNDPPTALLYSMEGQNLLKSDPTEPVIFIQEQQIQPAVFDLAIYTAFDVDIDESIQLEISDSLSTSSGFSVQDSELPSCIDNAFCDLWNVHMQGSGLTQTTYNVTYAINNDTLQDIGIKRLKLAARDSSGTYSDVISIELWIVAMKCTNGGQCLSKYPDQYSCNDEVRTEGFDEYFTCNCTSEWTGQYCEEDVDECAHEPCSGREVCTNKDGGYECFCESGDFLCKANLESWSFALILVGAGLSLIIIVVVFYVARWKYRQVKYRAVVDPVNGSEIWLQDDFDVDIPKNEPPLSTFINNKNQDDILQTQFNKNFDDDDHDFRHPAPDVSQQDIVTVKLSEVGENAEIANLFPSAGLMRPPNRNVHFNTALLVPAMPPVEGQDDTEF